MFSAPMAKVKLFLFILLFFIISTVLSKGAKQNACEKWKSVPLENANIDGKGNIKSNGIEYKKDEVFRDIDPVLQEDGDNLNSNDLSNMRGCPCFRHSCIRKCCPKEQTYARNNKTGGRVKCDQDVNGGSLLDYLEFYSIKPDTEEGVEKVSLTGTETVLSHELKNYCLNKRMYPLSSDEFYLLSNGSLLQKTGSDPPYLLKTIDDYCVDMINGDLRFLMCAQKSSARMAEPSRIIPKKDSEARLWIYPICMITSLPFLTATCLLYCFIPDLNNLVGKSLSSLTFSRILVTFPLTSIQLYAENLGDRFCSIVGFPMGSSIGYFLVFSAVVLVNFVLKS